MLAKISLQRDAKVAAFTQRLAAVERLDPHLNRAAHAGLPTSSHALVVSSLRLRLLLPVLVPVLVPWPLLVMLLL